jgi:hypothetical protein
MGLGSTSGSGAKLPGAARWESLPAGPPSAVGSGSLRSPTPPAEGATIALSFGLLHLCIHTLIYSYKSVSPIIGTEGRRHCQVSLMWALRLTIENLLPLAGNLIYHRQPLSKAHANHRIQSVWHCHWAIPSLPAKEKRRRPWKYDKELYKKRNKVERFFHWYERFRRICTRYDKLDRMFVMYFLLSLIYESLR